MKTTQPQQDRTSTQEPKPPTHLIMACLSKYREYREQFDHLQLIKEDFFKYGFDEVEISQIKGELSKFKRETTENFAKTVNRFDSLYTHLHS